jgi:hypothetical protein
MKGALVDDSRRVGSGSLSIDWPSPPCSLGRACDGEMIIADAPFAETRERSALRPDRVIID